MPDTIDRARDLIQARLHEVQREIAELEDGLKMLTSLDGLPSPRRPSRRRASRRSSRRAPRGRRREQFLAALEKSPGASVSEVAREIGVSAQQANSIAHRLRKDRLIRRSGKGYRLAAKAGS